MSARQPRRPAKDAPDFTEFYAACRNGDEAAVRTLIDAAEVNQAIDGASPLFVASLQGHAGVVELLLAKGASVSATDPRWLTPLHAAATRGHLACVRSLVAAGADVTALSCDGFTPVHCATESRPPQRTPAHDAVAAYLLDVYESAVRASLQDVLPGKNVSALQDAIATASAFMKSDLTGLTISRSAAVRDLLASARRSLAALQARRATQMFDPERCTFCSVEEYDSEMIGAGVVHSNKNAGSIARIEKAVKQGKSDPSGLLLHDLHGAQPGRRRQPQARRRLPPLLEVPLAHGAGRAVGRSAARDRDATLRSIADGHVSEHIRNLQRPESGPSGLLPVVRSWALANSAGRSASRPDSVGIPRGSPAEPFPRRPRSSPDGPGVDLAGVGGPLLSRREQGVQLTTPHLATPPKPSVHSQSAPDVGNRKSLVSLNMRELVEAVSTNVDTTYKPGYGGM